MAKKGKVALFDVDETLIGKDYQFTSLRFPEAVAIAQRKGWLIGLNSDAPILRLSLLAQKLGMNGPLIGELGSVMVDNAHDMRILWENQAYHGIFPRVREGLVREGRKRLPEAIFTLGDKAPVLQMMESATHKEERTWVVIHGLRNYSLGFYALRYGPKGRSFDLPALQKLADFARLDFRNRTSRDPIVDLNPDYGICILHQPQASKQKAVPEMLARFKSVVMVGNSMSDFLDHRRIMQCAVGNASEELKSRSAFVSSFDLTLGAIECLDWAMTHVP